MQNASGFTVEEFASWFTSLEEDGKRMVIKFAIENKPSGSKLKDIMGLKRDEKAFDLDLVEGGLGEIAFLNIATSGKHEIKRDFKVSETGKLAIELMYNGVPSGISATKAPFFVYWLSGEEYEDEIAVVIVSRRLKDIAWAFGFKINGGDEERSLIALLAPEKLMASNSEIEAAKLKAKSKQIGMF